MQEACLQAINSKAGAFLGLEWATSLATEAILDIKGHEQSALEHLCHEVLSDQHSSYAGREGKGSRPSPAVVMAITYVFFAHQQ